MTTASTNNQRDGRGSIPRGIDRLLAGIADARKETPIETNRRLCAMARIQRKEADTLPGRFGNAWATLNQLAPAKPAAPAHDPEHPVCPKCGGLASHDNSGWHCCGKQIDDPEPVDHRAEFLADFHAKADMVLPVRDGIPPHADQDVDLRAVLDEQAADLRRTRIKCDCCPDCGEPMTEFEQAFDALGHDIHGKQTRECSDACGWDGEDRNSPARSWR